MPNTVMPIAKRCNYYFDDGEPRRAAGGLLGCKRGDGCRYVHPDDPAWFTAKASDPPPPSFLWQEKEHSPSKLSRAPMRRFGNDREDEAYGPVRPPPPSYRSSPPRGDISSRSHTRRSRSPMSTSSRDPGLSKRVRSDPKSVPPIEPLLPPPPLPSLPELLKGNLGEPTIKEKEDVWLERVKLFAEAHQHREALIKNQEELRFSRELMQRSHPSLAAEGQAGLKNKIDTLEAECANSKKLRDVALAQLAQTNFWPIYARSDTQEAQQKKYQDMMKSVTDLQGTVTSIHGLLQTAVTQFNSRLSGEKPPVDNDERPVKRRRVDTDNDVGMFEGDTGEDGLSEAMEKVQLVERRLSDLKNVITQRDTDIMDEVNHAIDARWAEGGPPLTAQDGTEEAEAVAEVKRLVTHTGSQMGELAEEVGAVILRVSDRTKETAQLKEKYARTLAEIAEEKTRMEERQAANQKAIEALKADITTLESQPPPSIPIEYIIDSVEEPIQDMLRTHIAPIINGFQREMKEMLHSRSANYDTLWAKLAVTQKMVNAIAHQVNREQAGQVDGPVPVPVAAT